MKILINEPDNYSEKAIRIYSKLGKILFPNDLDKINKDGIEIIVIKLKYAIDKSFLKKFKNLKYIVSSTTGITHIDTRYCKNKNIKLVKLDSSDPKLKFITSTAEFTFCLILMSIRNAHKAFYDFKNNNLQNRESYCGRSTTGLVLGVIGYGRVGKKVTEIAKKFNMKVIVYEKDKKIIKLSRVSKINFVRELKDIFLKADIVSIHASYNDSSNKNLIDKSLLINSTNCPYIINTSRGELINEKDIIWALKKNFIKGIALDVIQDEYSSNPKIYDYIKNSQNSNIIITPHLGGCTIEAMQLTEEIVAKKLYKFIR